MTRKSSIHFKPVNNVRFAASHSERTDLSEPSYLLPKEHQLGNIIVSGSLPENELSALFIKQKEGMSRQAKTAGASPFWEGVLVLPNTNGREQEKNLKAWQKAYEKATGHKVLHMSIHLDEGYIDSAGKPQYNPHAHVILSRMGAQNRVINLDRKQLATVQDLTADALKMERGSTLEERQGRRGRKHIPHAEFRTLEDAKRQELVKQIAVMKEAHAREVGDLKGTIEKLKADYAKERQALKESGEAKQADYQRLKQAHEAALAELKAEKQRNAPAKKPVEPPKQVAVQQPQSTPNNAAKERLYRLMDEIERGGKVGLNKVGREAYERMKKGREQGKMDALNEKDLKEFHQLLDSNKMDAKEQLIQGAREDAKQANEKLKAIREAWLAEQIRISKEELAKLNEKTLAKGYESLAKAKAHMAVMQAHEDAKPVAFGRAVWAEKMDGLTKTDKENRARHEAITKEYEALQRVEITAEGRIFGVPEHLWNEFHANVQARQDPKLGRELSNAERDAREANDVLRGVERVEREARKSARGQDGDGMER